ncbi:MAG TPA: phenylalanine--tRNA ligase subunit beta [Patescibacteria group bacterium]|nr:phenylalanine--tRNA ligase subunit beta [Patescibacteria group bacterium]
MNIKILDSWLRDYVTTKATPKQIGEKLSLASVSVERIEKLGNDFIYDIEVTTNRPELMSVIGLARETAAVLKANNIDATFTEPNLQKPITGNEVKITIKNDPKLVNRVLAVVMKVTVKPSPKTITERLESTDIRSLNNLIDVTNYTMRVIGHPTHVFDYDRLNTKSLTIRESKKGETITTLDKKTFTLNGGDIIAENDHGEIVDLLGVMGLENSVVTDQTKRILFFIDNCDPNRIRKTSMGLAVRSEAAVLNEKNIDPELAMKALLFGIEQFEKIADGKVISEIIDIYPNKVKTKPITVTEEKIQSVIGLPISLTKAQDMLNDLGFTVEKENNKLIVIPPTFRAGDMEIPEDIIEEIARMYGYHNIPNELPPLSVGTTTSSQQFSWENHIKDTMKYWGFTEAYTYPMVSENLFEGKIENAVTIQNPLADDMVYMRRTLVPSLLNIVAKNKNYDSFRIFEIANIYEQRKNNLPDERLQFAGVIKKPKISFYEIKGILEQLLHDLGITQLTWKPLPEGEGAHIFIEKDSLGDLEILDNETLTFELEFSIILKHATAKKVYQPISKYPAVFEDLAIIAPTNITTGALFHEIKKQSDLIREVSLLDKYEDTRTFHIIYQSYQKNLTSEDIVPVRMKILNTLKEKFTARLKE